MSFLAQYKKAATAFVLAFLTALAAALVADQVTWGALSVGLGGALVAGVATAKATNVTPEGIAVTAANVLQPPITG